MESSRAAMLPGSRCSTHQPVVLGAFPPMDNGDPTTLHAAWMPDSGNTTVIRGCFPPMDNGEHLPTQGEPGRLSHFITDYCWAGGMGNGEWRKISASCFPGQGSWGNDQLGAANAPSSAMEWTMAPGKMQSNL